jgi:hypothetical protein
MSSELAGKSTQMHTSPSSTTSSQLSLTYFLALILDRSASAMILLGCAIPSRSTRVEDRHTSYTSPA